MVYPDREEIVFALGVLRDMCIAHDTCADCPAYSGICKIKYTDPEDYNLNTDTDVWRAFEND